MANLSIANVYNLKCPYCFAATYMADQVILPFIGFDAFSQYLDFLTASGFDQARLIGSEPTLHPQFSKLVETALARGFTILLFSQGLISERFLNFLTSLPAEKVQILIDMNATRKGSQPNEKESTRLQESVERLGARAILGFNIYRPIFSLTPVLDLIAGTECQPKIRLGLAQPFLTGSNTDLHPQRYPAVGEQIVHWARKAAAVGVRLEFDCGFVRCMFSTADLETLRNLGVDVGWRCNPILDLTPNGQAIHCFPLTGAVETAVDNDETAREVWQRLLAQTALYRQSGIYPECATCSFRWQEGCTGGCLAHTIRRFCHTPNHLKVGPRQLHNGQSV